MYEILGADNNVIGYADEPRYIRLKPTSGAFVPCKREDAQGIALKGTPYNLSGHDEIIITVFEDEEEKRVPAPEVFVREIESGDVVLQEIDNSEAKMGEVLCDMDIDLEDIKEALCEIDEKLENLE